MKYLVLICFLFLMFLLVGCEGGYYPHMRGFTDGYNSYPYYYPPPRNYSYPTYMPAPTDNYWQETYYMKKSLK
jgi:hypothetical protein